jgi:hypothetical protein
MYVDWFIFMKSLVILLYACLCILTAVLCLSDSVVISLCSVNFFFMSFRAFRSCFLFDYFECSFL